MKEEVWENLSTISINQNIVSSDHAQLMVMLDLSSIVGLASALPQERASFLGTSWMRPSENNFLLKSIQPGNVDIDQFKRMMNEEAVPDFQGLDTNSIAGVLETSYSVTNHVVKGCDMANTKNRQNEWDQVYPHW